MKKAGFFVLLSGVLLLSLAPLALAEETKTVDWYAASQNKPALEAKLAECRNNPGELRDTPIDLISQFINDSVGYTILLPT